jgi:NitT/TauT family transport system permease protein/taurine transport system permease protein
MAGWNTLQVPIDDRSATGAATDREELAEYRRERRQARTRRLLTGLVAVAVILVAWEIAAVALHDPVILPTVSATAYALYHYFNHPYPSQAPSLWFDLVISLRRIVIGFVIGVVLGVALGAAMSVNRVIRHAIDPIIEIIRPLPPLAFIPPLIVWFGIGELPKEVLLVFGVVPIMTIATVAALGEVPEDLRLCARTLGATRRYTLLRVQLRAALPAIIIGMRIAMAGAWTSIVAAEMLAATSGIGYLISEAGDYLDMSIVFAGIITIAIVGLILDALLRGLVLLADPSRRS